MTRKRTKWIVMLAMIVLFFMVYLLPFKCIIPVKGAANIDWNKNAYWYYPWGKSVVHKGIDIFAAQGTDVLAATGGIVIATGTMKMGGNYVAVLGPKWRITMLTWQKLKQNPCGILSRAQ